MATSVNDELVAQWPTNSLVNNLRIRDYSSKRIRIANNIEDSFVNNVFYYFVCLLF